jgi:hypothetical protein
MHGKFSSSCTVAVSCYTILAGISLAANGRGHRRGLIRGRNNGLLCQGLSLWASCPVHWPFPSKAAGLIVTMV